MPSIIKQYLLRNRKKKKKRFQTFALKLSGKLYFPLKNQFSK